MNIAFYTLGCKVNQFETQALELLLTRYGHTVTSDFDSADLIVINTCTVTAVSDAKSRKTIRHMAKLYPKAKIAVGGCLSQLAPESVSDIPGVALVSGSSDRAEFAEAIDALSRVNEIDFTLDEPLKRRGFELLPAGGLSGHTRALLKIEDGCTNFCSYCIIPYARGPVRSMEREAAVSESIALAEKGYREIVITGIEISSYGRDLTPKASLAEVVSDICSACPDTRIRLGSIEPRTITEEFCKKLRGFKNLCPHFHLSLQSGCDETLARMKRKYDSARFYESVSLLREHFPSCAITTDLIVGFPGETEEEFEKTLAFIEKCAFASMHIFPYSKRAGTPAASMENQLTRSEKAVRAKRALAVSERLRENHLSSLIGKPVSVLFEEEKNGLWSGHAMDYTRVFAKSSEDLHNRVLSVMPQEKYSDGIFGQIMI